MSAKNLLQYTKDDQQYMSSAIKLAKRGIFSVEPNPAVGAILVKNKKIIGRSYHKEFGKEHAEVNAIKDAIKNQNDVKNSTLYVTLEPCCHYGKTPPCTQAIIDNKIKKVVIADKDPSEKVNGKGIKILKQAGIEVITGVLAEQARQINRWFYKFHKTRKPWIICKWAQTIDGKLAASSGDSKWISSDESRIYAHKIRRSCQAIIVGANTVSIDDPMLTVRNVKKTNQPTPARVILDPQLKIKLSSKLILSADKSPVYICTTKSAIIKKSTKAKYLKNHNANLITLPSESNQKNKINLNALLDFATDQNWQRIMIEGGAKLISSFLSAKLADEIFLFIAPLFALDKYAKQFNYNLTKNLNDFLDDYQFCNVNPYKRDIIIRMERKNYEW